MRRALVLIAIVLALLAQKGDAQTLTVAWDPSTPGVDDATTAAGYLLYVGTESGVYTEAINVGPALIWTVVVEYDRPYYFALAAFNAGMGVGPLSVEVSGLAPSPAPPPPPPAPPSDTIAPVVALDVSRNGKSANWAVTATASDAGGLVSLVITINGAKPYACAAPFESCAYNQKLGKGTFTLTATAIDAAGHTGQASRTVTN